MKLRAFEAWLIAGLAVASAPLGPAARAQTPTGPGLGPWPTTTARPALPRPPRPVEADTAGQWVARPVVPIRRAEPDEADGQPAAQPAAVPESLEPPEPALPQDGVLETPEPPMTIDGADPSGADLRPAEDVELFNPTEAAAGYDASVFSIEPVPIEDRRPELFARLDPYAPTGIRIGSFLLFPETEIGAAAYSNLLRSSTSPRSDTALDVRPSVRLVSTWGVHAVEVGAKGLASFHNELPSEDDRAWGVDARGRLDITKRTNAQAELSHDVAQEARGTINSRASLGSRADVMTDRASASLNHRFNRLSLQLRGGITERDYTADTDASGALISNSDRDSTQHEVALRATWELKPSFAVFGEIGRDERSFGAPGRSDNIRRDSSGERYRAGVAFGNTGEIVRGEAAIGTLRQGFDDARLPEISGVIVDANVAWRITGLTSLLVTARTDVGESTVTGSGGALLKSGGVELRHAFRRNLIGSAGIRLTRADYEGTSLVEQDVTTSAGIEYYMSREVTLFGRYAHIDFNSTNPGSDYTADEVRVGVRVRR